MYKTLLGISAISIFFSSIHILYYPKSIPNKYIEEKYNNPNLPDTVNLYHLGFIVGVLPLGILFVTFQIVPVKVPNIKLFYSGLAANQLLTMCAVENFKSLFNSPRPDFLARCQPNQNGECTSTKKEVKKALRSFPSGHSALTTSSTLYTIYVASKTVKNRLSFYFLSFLLLSLNAFVCVSRVYDCKHFIKDVLGGIILALACSYSIIKIVNRKYMV